MGGGSYGMVCSAIDKRTNVKVAVKRIGDTFRNVIDAKRILREMKLMRHLKGHANVVSLHDCFAIPANTHNFRDVYIITKLFESDLAKIISSQQQLTDAHCRYFLYQLLRGLKYLHTANVIHRDLKPANLLVNSNCELAICDFGLARGVRGLESSKQEELTGYVVTRWYRAPELLVECDTYDDAIDMWSVGCILGELLGRRVLFKGRNYIHQLQVILECLGSPREECLTFMPDAARASVRALGKRGGVAWKRVYPHAGDEALDLLDKMLKFDPRERITVTGALEHSYLSEYHNASVEPSSQSHFNFSFEAHATTKASIQAMMLQEMDIFSKGGAVPPPPPPPQLPENEKAMPPQAPSATSPPPSPYSPGRDDEIDSENIAPPQSSPMSIGREQKDGPKISSVQTVETQLQNIVSALSNLEAMVSDRFDAQDKKLGQLETKIDLLEQARQRSI